MAVIFGRCLWSGLPAVDRIIVVGVELVRTIVHLFLELRKYAIVSSGANLLQEEVHCSMSLSILGTNPNGFLWILGENFIHLMTARFKNVLEACLYYCQLLV